MSLADKASTPGASPSGGPGYSSPEQPTVHAVAETDSTVLPRGVSVGRYEIIGLLRRGPLGPTYRGRDRTLGREVMIKEFLPPSLATRSDGVTMVPRSAELAAGLEHARECFVEEARALSTLQRAPFLARVVDLAEANGTFYLVLDLVAGISLEDRLHGGKCLQPDEADRLLRALLEALLPLHEANLLHGDINPANVMLDMSGRPTLINVGGQRTARAVRMAPRAALSRPRYAAPEQLGDDLPTPATDIYGLAATLHCAIVGHPPPDPAERLQSDTYRRLASLAPPGFPIALLAGIDRGLELSPADRPPSVTVWQTMLWPAYGPRALTAARPSQVEAIRTGSLNVETRRPLSFWIAAGVAALIGMTAAAGFQFMGGTQYLLAAVAPSPPPKSPAGIDDSTRLALERADAQSHQAALEELRRNREADKAKLATVEQEMRRQEETRKKEAAEAAQAEQRRRQEEEQAILKKLDAEAAAKREADAAAQAKRQAEAEAEAKQLAEAAAKRLAESLDLKAAETEETALRLSRIDRQHVQVALNALGFDAGEFDGSLGDQTRKAIAQWQQGHKQPPTGFLTADQIQTILKDAPPQAIADFDALQDPRHAEANEVALQLTILDRQHVQVALASLNFDPGEVDSIFGPRTREMIAVWQTSRGDAPTGFLTSLQLQALLKQAAAAIVTYDETLEPTRAEARETALNLATLDRQRLQVALTAQGFDTWGVDGRFGPRTRQMIAAWQKAHDTPASGFLTGGDVTMILKGAEAALAKFDVTQKTAARTRAVPTGDGSTLPPGTPR